MKSESGVHQYRPGQFIFRENDISKCIYLVIKGTISVRKVKGSGFIEIARIYANEVVGELSFFDRQPRSAAAVALTETEVREISFASLDKIYAATPAYFKTIMASVTDRLRKADDRIRRLEKELLTEEGKAVPDESAEMDAAGALDAVDRMNDVEELAPEISAADEGDPNEKI